MMVLAVQKGLGRGMGALLGDPIDTPENSSGFQKIPLHRIEPNPDQPRREFDEAALASLAESIQQHGILQPLAVRTVRDGYYQIVAGERRWRAARIAGLQEVPAVIVDADDRTTAELALIENLQRQDLNPVEEAQGYRRLIDQYGLTQEETASRVGKSRPAVANALRLLNLSQPVLALVQSGQLSPGHARAVLTLNSEKLQLETARKIIDLDLSVRQAELMCKKLSKPAPAKKPVSLQVDYVAECEKDLSRRLGRGVRIVSGKRKGRFELEYYGQDDLQRLLDALMNLDLKQ